MHFSLRPWSINDLECLVKFANNKNIAKNMTNKFPYPYTKENGKQFIDYAIKSNTSYIQAIIINDEAAGGIGLHFQEDIYCKNAELGYWLAEPYWGNGIIPQAISQIVNEGFKRFDITRIYAKPFGTNYSSQKVLEKAGFKCEAHFKKTLFKNGEYIDELVYAITKND